MKNNRHNRILEIIKNNDIETQEELAARLLDEGFPVTQATVSRDIRELGLTKVKGNGGKQKYAVLSDIPSPVLSDKFVRVLRDAFVSADHAGNLLVIKTVSGMAMAAAAALDAFNFDNVLGAVAGDDTIMCAVRTEKDATVIKEKLVTIVEGNNGRGKSKSL